jgi:hypothetical protein
MLDPPLTARNAMYVHINNANKKLSRLPRRHSRRYVRSLSGALKNTLATWLSLQRIAKLQNNASHSYRRWKWPGFCVSSLGNGSSIKEVVHDNPADSQHCGTHK